MSLIELNFILDAAREKDRLDKVFAASLKGIDLEKNAKNPVQKRLEEVKRRAAEKSVGAAELNRQEFSAMGFGYVVED